MNRARAVIYDTLIARMTARWYAAVIERLPERCRLLDVGIGTGRALVANAEALRARDVRVTGVDIDADYVDRCRRLVAESGLAERIDVRLESIYDHRGGPYDAAYFSASFMLLPDPPAALRHVGSLLSPAGRVFFTQTFELRRSRAAEILKPLLRRVTSIDFGRVTYEADFRRALAAGGLDVAEMVTLDGGRQRASVLVAAQPSLLRLDRAL
jgi:SAM-dependent methyltransferase